MGRWSSVGYDWPYVWFERLSQQPLACIFDMKYLEKTGTKCLTNHQIEGQNEHTFHGSVSYLWRNEPSTTGMKCTGRKEAGTYRMVMYRMGTKHTGTYHTSTTLSSTSDRAPECRKWCYKKLWTAISSSDKAEKFFWHIQNPRDQTVLTHPSFGSHHH
jgi:hypothetical protein